MKITMKHVITGLLGGMGVGTVAGYFGGMIYTQSVIGSHRREYIDSHIKNPEFPEFMQCQWKLLSPDDGYYLTCGDSLEAQKVTKHLNELADEAAAPYVSGAQTNGIYVMTGIVGGATLLGAAVGCGVSLCTTQQESKQPLSINDEKNYQTVVDINPEVNEGRRGCCLPFFNKKVAPTSEDLLQNTNSKELQTIAPQR